MHGKEPLSRIILASASPRRLELLRSLGLDVEVIASGYREPELPNTQPADCATRHAREKLRAVLEHLSAAPNDRPVVAADTVVEIDGEALGKPHDAADAAAMLRRLSGREHVVHTAFALAVPQQEWVEELATTRVRFYRLGEDEIAEYVASGEPLDKAGGYGIQGRAAAMVEAIDGDFYTVMGFPLARFIRALRRSGFALPVANQNVG